MNRRYLHLPLLAILALSAVSCKKDGSNTVIAVVNGKQVTQKEFEAYLKLKRIPASDPKRIEGALDKYLEREALAQVIEKEKSLDADLVQAEVNEFKKEMLVSRYFEKILEDKVGDDAVKNFYESHAKDYEEKKVHVAHILVRTNKGMGETERKAKLTTAQEAYSKLKSGKEFAEVAEQYSEDKVSLKQGGDLGWLKEGSVDPRFSKKVFEMEPGAISEPFETNFGFHIVKVLEGAKTVSSPYAAKAGDIRYELRNKAKDAESERLKKLVTVEKKAAFVPSPEFSAAVPAPREPRPNFDPVLAGHPPQPPQGGGVVLTGAPATKPAPTLSAKP